MFRDKTSLHSGFSAKDTLSSFYALPETRLELVDDPKEEEVDDTWPPGVSEQKRARKDGSLRFARASQRLRLLYGMIQLTQGEGRVGTLVPHTRTHTQATPGCKMPLGRRLRDQDL